MNRPVDHYTWKVKAKAPQSKKRDWLLNLMAKNRGLASSSLQEFLNPTVDQILKVKLSESQKGADRVIEAIKNKQKIIVYSDYDADGLCATAIMWETLYDLGANVMPYVPHRIKEGYGMSIPAISQMAKDGVKLIITVDQGVTANEQVNHAKKLGIDVVITDHHVIPKDPPKPYALVHSTALCGAGVSWRFCYDIVGEMKPSYKDRLIDKLELAALATIADLVPLIGGSRTMVKLGLEKLAQTRRPGLLALIKSSRINGTIGTYEVGHILAPRINAMGRIEHGIESLRLICAKNQVQADRLASLLSKTNTRRQDLTVKAVESALTLVQKDVLIGVVSHKDWHEGVIGLVASRLVETYNRPMIAIAQGQDFSKGSARSIPGFNIVEAIRESSELLVDAGGHPMAAGFTIETKHIEVFRQRISKYASKLITEDLLARRVEIECELEVADITRENLETVEKFEPFGVGNSRPYFLTRGMMLEDVRAVGQDSKHVKLQVDGVGAIGFNMGDLRAELRPGYKVDLVYSLAEDKYNGNNSIQLKIKDLTISN